MVELMIGRFGDVHGRAFQDGAEGLDEVLLKTAPIAIGQERTPNVAFDEQSAAGTFLGRTGHLASVVGADEVVGLSASGTIVRRLEIAITRRHRGQLHRLTLEQEGLQQSFVHGSVTRHRVSLEERVSVRNHQGEGPVVQVRNKTTAGAASNERVTSGHDFTVFGPRLRHPKSEGWLGPSIRTEADVFGRRVGLQQ